jgi:hypothetical protein
LIFCFFIFTVGTSLGQDQPDRQRTAGDSPQQVTASVINDQVRFAAFGTMQRMRLEVFDQFGQMLFDSDTRDGNLLDWKIVGEEGQILPDGLYSCLVTVEDLSGRSSHRLGILKLEAGEVSFVEEEGRPNVLDQQAVTVLRGIEPLPLTQLAHDGKSGIVSSRGGLSFRVGDLLTGRDVEHMKLTEEGNLGIGVEEPEFKLDVGGMIRAEGIVFTNGTRQMMLQGGGPLGPYFSTETSDNNFFGTGAGASITTGASNSFFGASSGTSNTTASHNSFFGFQAGADTTAGWSNSFFGSLAGENNVTGTRNAFFGTESGRNTEHNGLLQLFLRKLCRLFKHHRRK